MAIPRISLIVLSLLALSACETLPGSGRPGWGGGPGGGGSGGGPGGGPGSGPQNPLIGRQWQLVEVTRADGRRVNLSRQQQARHTLRFQRGNALDLGLDCNTGSSTWSSTPAGPGGGTLTIGQVASTRMMCPAPSFGQDMALDLPAAQQYALSNGNRTLRITTRHVGFEFRAAN